MVEITVNVFSGRPDPRWSIDDDRARPFLAEIAADPGVITPPDADLPILRFSGIVLVLSEGLAREFGLPSEIRIAGGSAANTAGAKDLARRIVDTMPTDPVLTDELKAFLRDEIRKAREPPTRSNLVAVPPQPTIELPMLDGNCRYETVPYDPAPWNDPARIALNNCYNFGTNRMWDNFAQPGKASGIALSLPLTTAMVTGAARADGLRVRGQGAAASAKPRYFVALALTPTGNDFHWWRQCNASWGHKPGGSKATDLDADSRVIDNPETCNRGQYTVFGGYFYVPRHVNLAGR